MNFLRRSAFVRALFSSFRPAPGRRPQRPRLSAERLELRDCPAGDLLADQATVTALATAPTGDDKGVLRDVRQDLRTGANAVTAPYTGWYTATAAVTPKQKYIVSDLYTATAPTWAIVRFQLSDGRYKFSNFFQAPATATPTRFMFGFTAPDKAVSATVFHMAVRGTLNASGLTITPVGTTPPPADTTAPTVSVTGPAANATVSGTVTLTAQASDNVGVVGVQFYVDGKAVGSEDTTGPYEASLDTTTLTNGNHSVTAVARDAAGNSTPSAPVTFTVSNVVTPPPDTTKPTVSVTGPAASATVSGTVTLTAQASDNVGVVGVTFYVDGNKVGNEDTTGPYEASLDTKTLANGTHKVTAMARDAAGNSTTSAEVTFTASNTTTPPPDTTGPTVSVTGPAANASVSGTVTLAAQASDNVGVVGVTFYVDGTKVGSEVTTSPYQASLDTTTLSNGSHKVTAVARDAAGNSTTSAEVTFTVSNVVTPPPDTTKPTVSVTGPAASATVSGTVTLTAQASDNVGVVGVTFYVDGNKVGNEDTTGPYEASLDTKTLANGAHKVTAVARDAAGNSTTSAEVTFTVSNPVPDTTAPTVSVTGPAAGAAVSGTITIDASASDNVGVVGVKFYVDGNLVGSEVTAAPYRVALDTRTLSNGNHTITAVARDAAGNSATSAGVTVNISNTTTTGTNLIQNPSAETAGANGDPDGWLRGGWGNNSATYGTVAGYDGAKALRVEITSYTDGDAKWYFTDVPVQPNTVYTFSDAYRSNRTSQVLAQFTSTTGAVTYAWIAEPGATADWTIGTYQVTTPADVKTMTIFHLIAGVGWLETDKFSLTVPTAGGGTGTGTGQGMITLAFDDGWLSQLQNAVPLLQQNNLPASFYIITRANQGGSSWEEVQNPSLETAGSNGNPYDWGQSHTGTNTASFSYANTGSAGSRSARIDVQSYSSGDDAWYFQDVQVNPGTQYVVTHDYNSSVPTTVRVRFTLHNGSVVYVDGGTLAATGGQWRSQQINVRAPANADAMTVLHTISQVGTLSVDNYSVKAMTPYSDPEYMTPDQVRSLAAAGFEVGVHTMTHPDLTTLSAAGALAEIDGARADLIALGITPKTFVYPYGAYNAGIEQVVASHGFIGARTVNDGTNTSTTDHFALLHHEVDIDTTPAQVQAWINTAVQTKTWLILTFHMVDTVGDQYRTTPQTFQQIVNMVKASNLTPVTMADGVSRL